MNNLYLDIKYKNFRGLVIKVLSIIKRKQLNIPTTKLGLFALITSSHKMSKQDENDLLYTLDAMGIK